MVYQPCKETLVINSNGNKTVNYNDLLFWEKWLVNRLYKKTKENIYFLTNNIGYRRVKNIK